MIDLAISVIVPARDAAGTLPDTLDALAGQTFADPFEVIVVDDGSADATVALAERSRRVDHVIRADGRGPAHARNAGGRLARAQRLAFLDADCRPAAGWLRAGHDALCVEDAGIRYRRHPGGLTADIAGLARAQLAVHSAHADLVDAATSARVQREDRSALTRERVRAQRRRIPGLAGRGDAYRGR